MRFIYLALLLCVPSFCQAEASTEYAEGNIQFESIVQSSEVPGLTTSTMNIGEKLKVAAHLGAVSQEGGQESVSLASIAINETGEKLYYRLYIALFDADKRIVAVIQSKDVMGSGVEANKSYRYFDAVDLPINEFRRIVNYKATLYVSNKTFRK